MTTLTQNILEIPEQSVGGVIGSYTVPANKYIDYTLSAALINTVLSFPVDPGFFVSGPFSEYKKFTNIHPYVYKARINEGVTIDFETFSVGNTKEPGNVSEGPQIFEPANAGFNFIFYKAYLRIKLDGISAFVNPVGEIEDKLSYGSSFPATSVQLLSTPVFEVTHTTEIYAVPKENFPEALKEGN